MPSMHSGAPLPCWLSRVSRSLPYLAIFLGFALRLYRIGYQSIWWDEARSIQLAEGGLGAVLELPGTFSWNHPPLYFSLLTGWTRLVGFSELGVRYLSLLLGMLLIPVTYRVGKRLFDRPTGLVAMTLAALAPLYVTYSQEARAYALLPTLYLLLIYALHRVALTDDRPPFRYWIALAIAEALLIYSHYATAPGLLYANLFLLVTWLWQRRLSLRDWIGSQTLALALFAPWLLNVVAHAAHIQSRLGERDLQAVPPSIPTFAHRVGGFLATGNLAAVEGELLLRVSVAALGATFALALALVSLDESRRRQMGLMLTHALGPLALCFGLWQIWPQAQPRYTLVFSIPLVFVMGHAIVTLLSGHVWNRLVGLLLVGSLALTFGGGLYVQYFDEAYQKDDARNVAAYLERVATTSDEILVSPNDYSVPYYYDGPATVEMARNGTFDATVRRLKQLTAGKQDFILVRWKPSSASLHGLRAFLLERAGQLEARRDFRGLDVRVYALDSPTGDLPKLTDAEARFGPLLLTGVSYEPTATTDDAVTVALSWQVVEPVSASYKVVVMLLDREGNRLSSADVLLLDEDDQPTLFWEPGADITNFYVVPVPVGIPPLPVSLAVGVYDAETLERLPLLDKGNQPTKQNRFVVGEVALMPGTDFDSDPYGTWAGVPWETPAQPDVADGLALERFAVMPRAPLPGQPVTVLLRWRAEGTVRKAVAPTLQLSTGDRAWAEVGSPLLTELYPPNRWKAGEVVVERRVFTYPPVRDVVDLSLVVGEREFLLGQMQLDEAALTWEWDPPHMQREGGVQIGDFAELAGYDLDDTRLSDGEPFQLTLYWRALNDAPLETPYTVFTQLLAEDGHLIAQHDGPPAGNNRPTTSWVGGEIIADEHTLTFSDTSYSGPARLIVGLYDSETITRVGTSEGQDYIVLSARIVVRASGS